MEQFQNNIKALAKRTLQLKDTISTEEATKTSLVMPFFQSLGYDVFNPEEFLPEFTADVGIKKGEKVDYAIILNNEPMILIEAKSINENLQKHDSQLFRYFGTSKAKFGILTNGQKYYFYTDLEEPNKMDSTPFFTIDLENIKDTQITELEKFRKNNFDLHNIIDTASELKYLNAIKSFLYKEFEDPSESFISFILTDIYNGRKTQAVLDKFNSIVRKSLKQFLNETVSDKLQAAIQTTVSTDTPKPVEDVSNEEAEVNKPAIITTTEEIEGYVIAKLLLKEIVDEERIYYRDNLSYFNVLLDDSIRKWICRLYLDGTKKSIQINDENKTTFTLDKLSDITLYKEKLIDVLRKFI
ncbi:endonuclease [Bacillus sp. FJAT-25509]|uniref:type I restriction endonuclease n=1 Tax=Bacillus sp. FJAT-25509 TaxID=1712029 RepID=UPI0006FD219E|nr:type I restriction endonuclease [Bacillus sp. FJAT-25509]KQL39255.1 endonuclease [Bacillus sp. FJAT-25509]